MSGEIIMTVVGNLTADAELRYTQGGLAVANFTIASTPRIFDRAKNEFVDGETTFLRCSVWREYAENVAGSLTKGTRVIAQGRFKSRQYEDKEGNKRTSNELEVDEIGPSLRYATAAVQRIQRDHGTRQAPSAYQSQQDEAWANASDEPWVTPMPNGQNGTQAQQPQAQPTFDEPWAQPGGSGANGYDSETPF